MERMHDSATAAEPKYRNELLCFLSSEYGLNVEAILPAKRGFYGETWDIQAGNDRYFLKIDYWSHHKEEFQNSLSTVQYMTDNGISFVPKVIRTKDGHLYSRFRQGTAAVFEYVPGELSENCPTEHLYGCLAKIYRLEADRTALTAESFDARRPDTFRRLRELPGLPAEVKKALAGKEPAVSWYGERLKYFSAACRDKKGNFHITHGDAGGNCILNKGRLFLVDWDSCLLAPVERDAWISICDRETLEKIQSVLAVNGVDDTLEQNRLCYYCYDFFFHYLNEFLKAIAGAEREEQRTEISKSLIGYLTDSWIYKRLDTADMVSRIH